MAKKNPLDDFYRALTGGYPVGRAMIIEDDGPKICAFIVDAESDVFRIDFEDGDEEIRINFGENEWILLSYDQLMEIRSLCIDAGFLKDRLDNHWDEEKEDWVKYGRLITKPKKLAGA